MSIVKSIFISILFVPLLAFAQNQTPLPNAGLTPESPFYFLDKLGEGLRAFFTFNPEGKAHLQITFAAERISEIKVILETKGVEAPGLEVAQNRLQTHLAGAAAVLDSEKSKGRDVSRLASELDDEFEGPKSALEEIFKTQKRALESQEDTLKAKIRDARRAGDTAQVETLAKQLAEVKTQKELLEQEEDDQEEALEKEEERIKEQMEARTKAEKKIRKAEREKQEVLAEALKEGLTIPTEAFNAFDYHIVKAKSAFGAGKFEEAKLHAEEAKESLDKVEDARVSELKIVLSRYTYNVGELIDVYIKNTGREPFLYTSKAANYDMDSSCNPLIYIKDSKGNSIGNHPPVEDCVYRPHEVVIQPNEEKHIGVWSQRDYSSCGAIDWPDKLNCKGTLVQPGKYKISVFDATKEIEIKEKEQKKAEEKSRIITVSIRSGRFDDSVVDVKRGDTVRWINRDTQPHWPASNPHPIHTSLPSFDPLRPINPGESYEFIFGQQGTFGYHDHLNPAVVGTIIVK